MGWMDAEDDYGGRSERFFPTEHIPGRSYAIYDTGEASMQALFESLLNK